MLKGLAPAAASWSAAIWTHPQADLTAVSVHVFGFSALVQQTAKILRQSIGLLLNLQLQQLGLWVFPFCLCIFYFLLSNSFSSYFSVFCSFCVTTVVVVAVTKYT